MTDNNGNSGAGEQQPEQQQPQQQQQQQQQQGRGRGNRRGNRNQQQRATYKSKVPGLETAIFSAKGSSAGYNNNIIAIADHLVGPDVKFLYPVGSAIRTRTEHAVLEGPVWLL